MSRILLPSGPARSAASYYRSVTSYSANQELRIAPSHFLLSLAGAFVFVFVFEFQFVFLYHRDNLDHHDHHHHHDDLDHHDHLDQLTESVWSSWRSTKGRNLTALSFPLLCKYHEEPQSTIKYNKIPQSTTNYRKVPHCTTSSKKCPIMLKGTYWLLNKSFLKSLWLCKHRGNNCYHQNNDIYHMVD